MPTLPRLEVVGAEIHVRPGLRRFAARASRTAGRAAAPMAAPAGVDRLVAERTKARARKDFATSDQVRPRLAELGMTVDDHADGTSSRRWTSG